MNTLILERLGNIEELKTDVFSRLLESRIIFIDNLIDDGIAMDFLAMLLHLDKQNNEKITLFINSEGGDIRNVFAIYDAMQLAQSTIETICIGSAMREAVLLLAAGTPGHRFITKNSDICLSQITSQYMSQSDLTNTKISHNKTLKDNESFIKSLSLHLNKNIKTIKADTERQYFMTPIQAIKYGIADKVI